MDSSQGQIKGGRATKEAAKMLRVSASRYVDSFFFNLGPFGRLRPLQDREDIIGPLPRPNKGGQTTKKKQRRSQEYYSMLNVPK